MIQTSLLDSTAVYAFTPQGLSLAIHLIHLLQNQGNKARLDVHLDACSNATSNMNTPLAHDSTPEDLKVSSHEASDTIASYVSKVSDISTPQYSISITPEDLKASSYEASDTIASYVSKVSNISTPQYRTSIAPEDLKVSSHEASDTIASYVSKVSDISTPQYSISITSEDLKVSSHQAPDTITPEGITLFIPERLDIAVPYDVPLQRFSRLSTLMEKQFHFYKHHIFIAATGIVVRSIAPHIQNKTVDPAVVVIDQKGQFVISLLSGHIGNANDITAYIATQLHATPVITTATDVEGLPAIDSLATKNGLSIDSMEAAKNISAALLASKEVQLYDPYDWLGIKKSSYKKYFIDISHTVPNLVHCSEENTLRVIVTEKNMPKNPHVLTLAPPLFCVGVGCKRGTSADAIMEQLQNAFAKNDLSLASLHSLASVDVKKDEQGILDVAKRLKVPVIFFTPEELDAYPTLNVSKKCLATFGIKGVCESAALAAAGKNAHLEQEKIAGNGVTIAIARRPLQPLETE